MSLRALSNHAHSHTARITRVIRPQSVGFTLVLSFYKVVNPWTSFVICLRTLSDSNLIQYYSKTSPGVIMYAKLLLRRNNMKRPSEMRRSLILRRNPWCQRRPSTFTDHFLEHFLRARTPDGTLKTFFSNDFICFTVLLKEQGYFWLFKTFVGGKNKKSNFYSQPDRQIDWQRPAWPNLANYYKNREEILLHSIIFQTESMTSLNKFIETLSFADHKTRYVLVLILRRDNLQAKILSLDKPLSKDHPMKLVLK